MNADPLVEIAAGIPCAEEAYYAALDKYENESRAIGFCFPSALVEVRTPDGTYTWSKSEIIEAAKPGGIYGVRISEEVRDRALADLDEEQQKARETEAALGLRQIHDAVEEANTHLEELIDKLIDERAQSTHGLAAKLRALKHGSLDGNLTDWAEPLLDSIIKDAERLAGGAS